VSDRYCVCCECQDCSLGDERFCARCLAMIAAAADIGIDLLYDWLSKVDAFATYLQVTGQT
jgi:hypothetical protein